MTRVPGRGRSPSLLVCGSTRLLTNHSTPTGGRCAVSLGNFRGIIIMGKRRPRVPASLARPEALEVPRKKERKKERKKGQCINIECRADCSSGSGRKGDKKVGHSPAHENPCPLPPESLAFYRRRLPICGREHDTVARAICPPSPLGCLCIKHDCPGSLNRRAL
ncbi:hypothetical protein LX32DRAFT_340830 [Colletotrichum zoysiae]|uniref:Uncharacterized protein n=1 Tax=Colletotrichum zoysiae TaxID=1216348 RepID=A0AAD9M672_9PEZI|nr:hypothetical protein LX32DRAFT_340830 [Colletotrichum zoysiae]